MNTVEKIKKSYDRRDNLDFLYFFGHKLEATGLITNSCFSQWWYNHNQYIFDKSMRTNPNKFQFENSKGIKFRSAEHYMMYEKANLFYDEVIAKNIIDSLTPHDAKKFGRIVHNFDNSIWDKNKIDIVRQGNIYKFEQNPDLLKVLMDTRGRILVEASPYDRIWGIGIASNNKDASNPHRWKGQNLLGFILTDIRDNYFS